MSKPCYSEYGLNNRSIIASARYPLILYVEDEKKEYVYESILMRMFNINGRPNDSILQKINILGLGGKDNVLKRFKNQGTCNEDNSQRYIYLLDGDFDRYIWPEKMLYNENIIYLEAYCIESYFLDELGCIEYIQGRTGMKAIEVKQVLNFNDWKRKIVNESVGLFLYYACCRQYRGDHPKAKVPNSVSGAGKQLDPLSGFLNPVLVRDKITEITKTIEDTGERVETIMKRYEKRHEKDYFWLICGKFLFQSLAYYVSSVFTNSRVNWRTLVETMRKSFDIKKLEPLHICLMDNLKNLKINDNIN